MAEISRHIARAHPAILTSILLLSLGGYVLVSTSTVGPPVRVLVLTLPIGVICLWLWAVFAVARASSGGPKHALRDVLFAVPPALDFTAKLAGWSMNNSPAAFVFFASLFVALWFAAQALENADAPGNFASVGRILATALIMYLAPVGVWILHSKIMRVADRTAASPAAA